MTWKRVKIALALAFIILYVVVTVYLIVTMPTEVKVMQINSLREMPGYIFWPIAISIMVAVGGPLIWILINQKGWSLRARKSGILNAKKVALSLWRVENTTITMVEELRRLEAQVAKLGYGVTRSANEVKTDKSIAVRFRHFSFNRQWFLLPVREGHPDIEVFRRLQPGDVVEFEPLSEGMECALEGELCGYLRIKDVS